VLSPPLPVESLIPMADLRKNQSHLPITISLLAIKTVMMNTLDLTIDMMFFELKWNPWTVRNVLEHFVEEYSYTDKIFSPDNPEQLLEGGISFAHDMGVDNHFSPKGYSSYECSGLDRKCFSYMTSEQLTNWVLIAGVYFKHKKN
jgi:hypothetical protein